MTRPAPQLRWPPPAHWVGRVQAGTLLDAPLLPGPRTTPWTAVVWPDGRAPGGWARGVLPPGRHSRGWMAATLAPGDVIEFGADQPGRRRQPPALHRWYGVVLATDCDRVVAWGPFPEPGAAWACAQQALSRWRAAAHVDVPGVTDLPHPDLPQPDRRTTRPAATPAAPAGPGGRVYAGYADGTVEVRDSQGVAYQLRPGRRFTPDGFGWGHHGDSAAELAHALLADATGSADTARRLTGPYTDAVTSRLPAGHAWTLPVAAVRDWAAVAAQPQPPASGPEVGL